MIGAYLKVDHLYSLLFIFYYLIDVTYLVIIKFIIYTVEKKNAL